jgi:glutamate decarboxylase
MEVTHWSVGAAGLAFEGLCMATTVTRPTRSSELNLDSGLGHRLRLRNLPAQIPRDRLGDDGLEADLAYQLVHDHLMLDGNARLNLATFVGTWMEPEARRLMEE